MAHSNTRYESPKSSQLSYDRVETVVRPRSYFVSQYEVWAVL